MVQVMLEIRIEMKKQQMEEDENLEDELDRVDVIFPARVQFDFEGFYNWSPLEKRRDCL